jgi:hypothetical protein
MRYRLYEGDRSTVLQLSVGEEVHLDAPGQLEHVWSHEVKGEEAIPHLATEIIEVVLSRLEHSPMKRNPIPLLSKKSGKAKSKEVQHEHTLPPPVVLASGALVSTDFRAPPRLEVPFRMDGYLGSFGMGLEFRYTAYAPFIPVDGYNFYVQPITIVTGPRVRLGHSLSLFSFSTGLSGGIEMGRGHFFDGDVERLGSRTAEALKKVYMINGVVFARGVGGVRIHRDFYAFISGDFGVRIPEKRFSIDDDTDVTFETHVFSNVALGVEVRIP